VPDLELGALILGLRVKGESLDEMLGFLAATDERTHQFEMPHGRGRPVVLPTYNGARKEANLTPLLALLLQRFGVPVLVHGLIEGYGRVTSAHIFRELDVLPVASVLQAQAGLDEKGLAFLPLSALCPGIHNLLSLRARMGVRNSAHSLVKLLDPFRGEAVLVAPATHPDFIELMRNIMQARGQRGLLLRGTEGEPYANAKRRPRLEHVHDGVSDILFEAEHESLRTLPNLLVEHPADPACRTGRIGGFRQIGSAGYSTSRFRCPSTSPINSPACCSPAAMPKTSTRPKPSLPLRQRACSPAATERFCCTAMV
jgi:anthranilate phosphoribosyltransferase